MRARALSSSEKSSLRQLFRGPPWCMIAFLRLSQPLSLSFVSMFVCLFVLSAVANVVIHTFAFLITFVQDGFKGSYEEVLEHEKKYGLNAGNDAAGTKKEEEEEETLYHIYEAMVYFALCTISRFVAFFCESSSQ
jgi:hypothetical protein